MCDLKFCALALMALTLTGCGGSSQTPTNPPLQPPPSATPRLDPGPYLGYLVGFDALSQQQTALADSLQSQAIAAGQNFTRVQLDWQGLESAPGVFETADLMAAMDAAAASQQSIFVTVTTLDTGSLTLPVDLMSADASTTALGLALDGPEIRARFRAFLDWLVPELAAYNVWGVALANESSTNFDNVDQDAATRFLVDGIDYARALDADLAVTVTIIGEFLDADVERFADDLMPHLDIAMFNFYCIDGATLLATDSTHWADSITKQISVAAGRQIVYQELGCPAGYADLGGASPPTPTIGATVQRQTEFFDYFADQISARDELRGAYIFQLIDWSPALAQSFADGLLDPNDPGSAVAVERLVEWLMTVGMCRWSDNACRPAWDAYLDGVVRTANIRASTS